MNLKEIIKQSNTFRLTYFFFADNYKLNFSSTKIAKLFLWPSNDFLAQGSLLIAILLYWYERFLESYVPVFGLDFLPLLLLGVALFFSNKEKFVIKKYHLWFLGFLFMATVAGTIGAFFGFGRWEIILGLLLFVQFGLGLVAGELLPKKLEKLLIISSAPLIAAGYYEFFTKTGGTAYTYLDAAGMRVDSLIGNPNIFGFILVILVFISLKALLASVSKFHKMFYIIILTSLFLLLLGTGSRAALLSLAIGGLVLVFLRAPKLIKFTPLFLLVLLVERVRARFFRAFSPEYLFDSSINGRLWSFKNSFYIWSKNILGTGPGTYGGKFAQQSSSPVYLQGLQNGYPALLTTDNQYLSLLVQTGILGILSFLGFLVSLFTALISKKEYFGAALLSAFAVMMFFSNAMDFSAVSVPLAVLLGQALKK